MCIANIEGNSNQFSSLPYIYNQYSCTHFSLIMNVMTKSSHAKLMHILKHRLQAQLKPNVKHNNSKLMTTVGTVSVYM